MVKNIWKCHGNIEGWIPNSTQRSQSRLYQEVMGLDPVRSVFTTGKRKFQVTLTSFVKLGQSDFYQPRFPHLKLGIILPISKSLVGVLNYYFYYYYIDIILCQRQLWKFMASSGTYEYFSMLEYRTHGRDGAENEVAGRSWSALYVIWGIELQIILKPYLVWESQIRRSSGIVLGFHLGPHLHMYWDWFTPPLIANAWKKASR